MLTNCIVFPMRLFMFYDRLLIFAHNYGQMKSFTSIMSSRWLSFYYHYCSLFHLQEYKKILIFEELVIPNEKKKKKNMYTSHSNVIVRIFHICMHICITLWICATLKLLSLVKIFVPAFSTECKVLLITLKKTIFQNLLAFSRENKVLLITLN